MINRDLVTSGFDSETIISEAYITYILLAQIEAGLLPLEFTFADPGHGIDLSVTLHPPVDYFRRYDPEPSAPLPEPFPGSFFVELLPEGQGVFMHLTIFANLTDNLTGEVSPTLPAGLLIDLNLEREETDNGLERNHSLRISLVRFDDATTSIIEQAGADPEVVLQAVRDRFDRSVRLGTAQGQRVQRIRIKKFVDGQHRSVGLYVDLALRSGPEKNAFLAPRGDLSLAQDFRQGDAPLAFATSPSLFDLLGPDLMFRQSEETELGSGEFRYPLREDPLDTESDEIGRIKGIKVGPEINLIPGQPPTPSGRLIIDVHGEYTDAIGDPDFHLQLFFKPIIEDGIVQWDLDIDVDLGLLATLLLVAAGIGLLFSPLLGLGSSLIVGTIVGLAVLKGLIVEPLAAKIVEDHIDEDNQASFLDALPFRVPAARRRWDPFYLTLHQVAAIVDQVTIDFKGIDFSAIDRKLDKQPVPIGHIVIRDEERFPDGAVTALRYRVSDFRNVEADLNANGPGRDRMDYIRADPVTEPTLVSLTDAQIADRIQSGRLLAPLTYTPERIYLVGQQIESLLCLSRREQGEQQQRLIDDFRASTKDEIIAQQGDQIRQQVITDLEDELGRPPTEDEIAEVFDLRIEALVDVLQPDFEENELPGLLQAAIAQILRFDMAPEELIKRQFAGVLLLDGKEIITRRNEDGTITRYYRDHPDSDPRDNLLSLPRYTPPYQPPPQ